MSSAFINKYKEYIIEQYVNEKKSTYEIAQDLKTYPNKIRRALNTLGVDLRDKSSAQTVAIESGRHEHPTRGKKRTEAEKVEEYSILGNYKMPQFPVPGEATSIEYLREVAEKGLLEKLELDSINLLDKEYLTAHLVRALDN